MGVRAYPLLRSAVSRRAQLSSLVRARAVHQQSATSQAQPIMDTLREAILCNLTDNSNLKASTLWREQPVVVVAFRRPGCLLCREEAQNVWKLKPELDALNVGLVGMLHERIESEVAEFHPKYWPGPLYHDAEKAFYRALGDGQLRKGSLFAFLNPWSEVWANARRAKTTVSESNLQGDGLTMGGLFVIGKGGSGIVFKHVEETFGDHASREQILEAARKASS